MTNIVSELFLSSVLGRPVINELGQEIGKCWDMIMVPGEVFPEVSYILVKRGKKIVSIPWRQISIFSHFVIAIKGQGQEIIEYAPKESGILVKRDILDKQIVDINGAKVVRVNDLKLGRHKDMLCIFSADVGFSGLLRRLGHEKLWGKIVSVFRQELPSQEISWEYVQPLEKNASQLTLTLARDQMVEMHPADIAHIIAQIPRQHIQTVLNSLDTETAGEAIHELEPELRSHVISQMDSELASDILEEMEADEAADVIGDLPEEKAQELLGLMNAEEAEEIQELLEHKEDTAGGLMNNSFLSIPPGLTVEETLREIRHLAYDIETVYYAYILDENETPIGVVSLRELLTSPPSTPISEIMTANLKTVTTDAEPEEVLDIVAKYNLIAVPVLNEKGEMAGIVTVDDILELFLPFALKRKRHSPY